MQIRNYYLLVILMAGVIDDFQDALNELLRAANLPVSVIVIKVGAMQEETDSGSLMNLSHEAFEKCDRQFVNIFNYEDHYKRKFSSTDSEEHVAAAKLMKDQFEHDLIQDIPKQIEKFFELQQFDVEDYEEEKTI